MGTQLPIVLCGIVAANLALILVIARIREPDRMSQALVPPTLCLSAAVFFRTAMDMSSEDATIMLYARSSYACALLVIPTVLYAVRAGTSPFARRAALITTTLVAGVAWADPMLFTGEMVTMPHALGGHVRVAQLSPRGAWLLPYGMVTSLLIWLASRKLRADNGDVVTGIRLATVVLAIASVNVLLTDTGVIATTRLEVVAATLGTTALAWVLLDRSGAAVEDLLAAGRELEAQRRACSDDARRLDRMAALGEAASTLVQEIDGPARELTRELRSSERYLRRAFRHDADARAQVEAATSQTMRAARRVVRIVRRVKEFANASVVSSMRCEARECLETAIGMLDHMARHHVEVEVELEGDATIAGSSGQLTRLFVLSLRSALRVVAAHGNELTVTLRASEEAIDVRIHPSADTSSIAMKDALEPYGDELASQEGWGLELATAYRLVSAFGGEMYVEDPCLLRIELPTTGEG